MTQAEYARHIGTSRQNISKMVAHARIPVNAEGKIDSEIADRLRDPLRAQAAGPMPAIDADAATSTSPAAGAAAASPATAAAQWSRPVPDGLDFARARTSEMSLRAERAQLELDQMAGRLVAKAEVEAGAFEAARITRDRLLALAAEIAPEFVGLTDERVIEARLRNRIRDALENAASEADSLDDLEAEAAEAGAGEDDLEADEEAAEDARRGDRGLDAYAGTVAA